MCPGWFFLDRSIARSAQANAARRFFAKCLYLADDDRDIDVYPTYYLPCLVLGSWFFILVGFIVGTSAFIY